MNRQFQSIKVSFKANQEIGFDRASLKLSICVKFLLAGEGVGRATSRASAPIALQPAPGASHQHGSASKRSHQRPSEGTFAGTF